MAHKLNISNASVNLLAGVLNREGAITSVKELSTACKLSDVLDVVLKNKPIIKEGDKKSVDSWNEWITSGPKTEIEITEDQRELAKKVITSGTSVLPVGKYTMELLELFGLNE